jgi:hypothetical protein
VCGGHYLDGAWQLLHSTQCPIHGREAA